MRRGYSVIALGSFLFAAPAFAQNWINPAGGSWGTPTNWSNDGAPSAPVFSFGSAVGYTTSLDKSYYVGPITVQNDNPTIAMNGFNINTPAVSISSGSLAFVGPGTVVLANGQTRAAGTLTGGQLIVNGAIVEDQGNEVTQTNLTDAIVENGGKVELPDTASSTIEDSTFNNGSFSGALTNLIIDQCVLTNGSNVQGTAGTLVTLEGNTTLDNSIIGSNANGTIEGSVTLSDHAGLDIPEETVSGTVTLLAGGSDLAMDSLTMQNGTFSIELNSQVSDPIVRPTSQANGTLDFTLQSGFEPTLGEQFDIFNPSLDVGRTGTFATINLPALPAGGSWDISSFYTNGTITVVAEPISMSTITFGLAALTLRRRRAILRTNS